LQVARELRCDVVHTEARQMDLFQTSLGTEASWVAMSSALNAVGGEP
jgi:hypothetical protein